MSGANGAIPSPAQQEASAQAQNRTARELILRTAIDETLQIASGVITTGPSTVTNVPGRNVGLVKRFWLQLSFTVTAPASGSLTLGPFGPASAVSNVQLTDLSNQQRINTSGWHLFALSSVKRRRLFGAAFVSDTPFGYGNNFTAVMSAPATIPAETSGDVNMFLEIPVTYTDDDLRGMIWAAVTNANFYLQFTLNPGMFANTGTTDATQALYISDSGDDGTLGNVTWTLYQNFLDQLARYLQNSPMAGQPILPIRDMGTAYLLNTTPLSGLVENQDNPFPYPNFRDIMSTTVIYDNGGALNDGDDINYWALQSANYTNIFKYTPNLSVLLTRNILGDDFPLGTYYFDHRVKPINTIQYGNMALLANFADVQSGASLLFAIESLAIIGQITQAGSLAGT